MTVGNEPSNFGPTGARNRSTWNEDAYTKQWTVRRLSFLSPTRLDLTPAFLYTSSSTELDERHPVDPWPALPLLVRILLTFISLYLPH